VRKKKRVPAKRKPTKAPKDNIDPQHYQTVVRRSATFQPPPGADEIPIQVADVIETFVPDSAHLAHALTYLLRAGEKLYPGMTREESRKEDIVKARWWLTRDIQFHGGHLKVSD